MWLVGGGGWTTRQGLWEVEELIEDAVYDCSEAKIHIRRELC